MNCSPCAGRGYASLILCIHIRHYIRHPHIQFQRNQADINIIIDIQSNISHIHWPLFEDQKEKSVEIGGVNLKKSRVVLKSLPKTWKWNKLMNIVHNVTHLNVRLKI